MNITDKLKKNKVLISDGALGTLLQARGLRPGECPELWNITRRKDVFDIAESYFKAGSDIVSTNSFGGSRIKLSLYGNGDKVHEINRLAAEITREAAGNDRHVAGSIGPTGKILLTGEITDEELYDNFCEQSVALEKGGADLILIETMSAADEAALAVKAACENTKCTVAVTMTFSKDMKGDFHTIMGVSPAEMVSSMKKAGAQIVGSNCGNGIAEMTDVVKAIRAIDKDIPLIIQANAGIPEFMDGKTVFHESPEMMASFIPSLIKAGANIIGGCCGTTPDHIREMVRILGR